jgi:hypothetical protein
MPDTLKQLSDYGAVSDARHIYLVKVTGPKTLMATSRDEFVATDVGKTIVISGGTDGATTFRTTVAQFISATEIRTSDAIPSAAPINHQSALIGTDCGPALQAALLDASQTGGKRLVVDGQYALFSSVSINWTVAGEYSGVENFVLEGDGSASTIHVSLPVTDIAINSANGNIIIRDLHFAGVMGAAFDARTILEFRGGLLTLENAGFYGLRAANDNFVIHTQGSDLYISRCRFGGCSGNSAVGGSVVRCDAWSAINIENSRFIDYGTTNGQSYSKTSIGSPTAWISVGDDNAPTLQALKSSVLRITNTKLDEGAYRAVFIAPTARQIDRVILDGLEINGWGSPGAVGIFARRVRDLTIARCSFGYVTYPEPFNAVALEDCTVVEIDAAQCNGTMRQVSANNVATLIIRNSPTLNSYAVRNTPDFRVIDNDRGGVVVKTKAGAITDADFPVPPAVGTLAANSTSGGIFVRRADGLWASSTVTDFPIAVVGRYGGTFQTIGASFTTIQAGTASIDSHNGWNATQSVYVAPQTGIYEMRAKLRPYDNSQANCSLGLGIDLANQDGPSFTWAQFPPAAINGSARFVLQNSRTAALTAGQSVRIFGYVDSPNPVGMTAAEFVIERIR